MSNRFYTNFELFPGLVTIQGPEVHHLANVRRLRAGDAIVLFNGDGNDYPAEIVAIDRKTLSANILCVEAKNRELSFRLAIAAPMPKGDRGDFLIEKLTELGVTDFFPLRTERSVVHPRETKLEKLQRTVIESSKQCGRNVLMRIHPLVDWSQFCLSDSSPSNRVMAHPNAPQAKPTEKKDVCAAVGPEGGFTDAEIDRAVATGWQLLGLGDRVLRVETAAIALAVRYSL